MRRSKSKSKQEPKVLEVSSEDLRALQGRAKVRQLDAGDCELVDLLIASYGELLELLRNKEISLARLRKMLFGASTEKTKDVLSSGDTNSDAEPPPDEQGEGADSTNSTDSTDSPDEQPAKPGRKGHGQLC